MAKFKVGDRVQVSLDSVDYYENHLDGKYCMISGHEWNAIYCGGLIIDKVYETYNPIMYSIEEIGINFYEFELERD